MRDERKLWKKPAAVGLSLLLALGASGCAGTAVPEDADQPIAVMATQVQRGDLASSASFTGTIAPDQSVSVYPKASGTVQAVHFAVGDEVKKGDLIFEIDPVDIQLQVDSAKAVYDAAVAGAGATAGSQDLGTIQNDMSVWSAQQTYDKAKAALEAYEDANPSKSSLRAAVTAAQADYDAAKQAYDALGDEDPGKEDAKDEMDDAKAKLTKAKTALSTYNSTIDQLENTVDTTRDSLNFARDSKEVNEGELRDYNNQARDAQLRQAELAYESAQRQLANTKVYAPVDGVLEAVNVSVNNPASSQGAACVIAGNSAMTVAFSLPAGVVQNLALGDGLTAECGGKTYEAEITEIGAAANAVGLYPVKAALADSEGLLSGMMAKVTLDTDRAENAMLLPISCLYYDSNRPYTYVIQDGVAVKTYLETGIANSESIVILSGISEGDQIVATWNPGLMDGAAVKVMDAQAETEIGE
ncbi:MAG: efflux RND transporter periplasmic adaptor subunit [Oscillospiraceae bacterium]|nr:efflux RND transporter periplasmic adaptor subunit [Oscillospiraceae bacterium]